MGRVGRFEILPANKYFIYLFHDYLFIYLQCFIRVYMCVKRSYKLWRKKSKRKFKSSLVGRPIWSLNNYFHTYRVDAIFTYSYNWIAWYTFRYINFGGVSKSRLSIYIMRLVFQNCPAQCMYLYIVRKVKLTICSIWRKLFVDLFIVLIYFNGKEKETNMFLLHVDH